MEGGERRGYKQSVAPVDYLKNSLSKLVEEVFPRLTFGSSEEAAVGWC